MRVKTNMAYLWQNFLALIPSIKAYFLVILFFMVAERLIPAERNQPYRNQMLSGQCTLLYFLVTPLVLIWPAYIAAEIVKTMGGSLFTVDLDRLRVGSHAVDGSLHHLALPLVPFLVFDFFYYWHHRLQHRLPALWAQHKLHHLEESLCCLTNLRHHWLEDAIRAFTIMIPMAMLITLQPVRAVFTVIIISYWSVFIHSNLRLPLGPLTAVLTGPQLHRIHHSREVQHNDKNFAAFFPIWDVIFGTYYRPQPGEWPATGIAGEKIDNLWSAMVLPFREWHAMLPRLSPLPVFQKRAAIRRNHPSID